jgi:hypothetical protein
MTTNLQTVRARIAALFRKTWVRVLTALTLCVALFLLLLPIGLQKGLQHWLVTNGADAAQVGSFAANLFTGRFAIHGMDVEREGKNVLSDSLLALDLNLGALFKKTVHVQRAVYEQATIDLEQLADGRWRYTSYLTGPDSGTVETKETTTSSPWTVLVSEMRLTDCVVRLKTPELQLNLVIDSAELLDFSTAPGAEGASFRFKGKVNEAPLDIHLDRLQVAPHLDLGGTLTLAGFDLGQLARLLAPAVQPFTGTAGIDGRLRLSLPAEGPRAEYEGSLELGGADIGVAGTAIDDQSLAWQGKASYTGSGAGGAVSVDGTLDSQGLAVSLADSPVSFRAGTLQLKGPIETAFGERFSLTSKAALTLGKAALGLPAGASPLTPPAGPARSPARPGRRRTRPCASSLTAPGGPGGSASANPNRV